MSGVWSLSSGRWAVDAHVHIGRSVRASRFTATTPTAVVSYVNITRRKVAERVLAHQAALDPLAGRTNRTLFVDRLAHSLTRRRRAANGDVGDEFAFIVPRITAQALSALAHRVTTALKEPSLSTLCILVPASIGFQRWDRRDVKTGRANA
jgi:GGDEF domain-containing protein